MPSRPNETRCTCIQCTQRGGLDASGKPKGVMIPSRHLSTHLARVQAEQEAITAREIEAVEAELVALTLTDDGPVHASQPSKLWTSRNEFQQDVSHTVHLPNVSMSPPISDILEGVSRLSSPAQSASVINHPIRAAAPVASTHSHSAYGSSQPANPSNTTAHVASTPISHSPAHGSSHNQTRKMVTNCRTTKVLQILDQMDREISTCMIKLSGTPAINVLQEVESTLNILHPRLAKVTRKAPLIDVRKQRITELLINLEARVAELKYVLNVKEPVSYNSG